MVNVDLVNGVTGRLSVVDMDVVIVVLDVADGRFPTVLELDVVIMGG